jgi:LPXTG-motif cell wall-anchored protein
MFVALSVPNSVMAQQRTVTVQLTAQSGSGVTGTATLTDIGGGRTRVAIRLTPATGDRPAHIHAGTCANLNPAPEFPLANVQNGTSTTEVNAALATIQNAQRAINLHQSPQEVATYVACGNIQVAGTQPPNVPPQLPGTPAQVPAALPATGDAATALPLAVAGGLALIGLGFAVRRRIERHN